MKSKIFLLSLSFVLLLSTKAFACGGGPENEYNRGNYFYMVTPLDADETGMNEMKESVDFWYAYLGKTLDKTKLESSIYSLSLEDFNAKKPSSNELVKALRKRGDMVAINYLKFNQQLYSYNNVNQWDYVKPSSKVFLTLAGQVGMLRPNTMLKPRVTYLKMRCLFGAKQYDKVLAIWNDVCSKWQETLLKRRAKGYVAGVYYHRGQYDKALEIFNKLGDLRSVNRCVSRLLDPAKLEQYVANNPNSMVLPYVMQDYANYLYHALNNDVTEDDKIWLKVKADYNNMMTLAKRILADSRVECPIMWQAFIGFLQFANGEDEAAYTSFDKALKMQGTADQIQLIRNLKFASSFGLKQKPANFTEYLLKELANMKSQHDSEDLWLNTGFKYSSSALFEYEIAMRMSAYCKSLGNEQARMLSFAIFDAMPVRHEYNEVWPEYFNDKVDREYSVAKVEEFYKKIVDTSGCDELTRGLTSLLDKGFEAKMCELVGTKYLREGNIDKAIAYLSNVPADFLKTQSIAPYLNLRSMPSVKFGRKMYKNLDEEKVTNAQNVKLQFCQKLKGQLAQLESLSGNAYADLAYEIANEYFQASPSGDLWAITEYGHSSGDEYNAFNDYAIAMIHKAIASTSDFSRLTKCYFALASIPQKYEGDDYKDLKFDYDWKTKTYKINVYGSEKEGYDWIKNNVATSDPIYRSCHMLKYYR